ncbi:MinD-like ATPase involved in chromosome partitioning or flagellar assembly [Nocardia tenerifensis]|uniref:MinD-like ATPase involved in chromosome partitioning or flagellar assembly n=1 Tax=Nocardia tenerifensis TaxID=228006 RepID=A0A318JRB2_9NOCA|nr:MinD/ParA family protein [Nocardia tenerifensis]PXX53946.1 MinD-like ATPase involved in chromosome partitioning or flagellar assembly [Nocardia tenerifensis]
MTRQDSAAPVPAPWSTQTVPYALRDGDGTGPQGTAVPRGRARDRRGWRHPGTDLAAAVATGARDWRRDTVRPAPGSGWRRALYLVSGKALNPGQSPAEVAARALDRRLRTAIESDFRIGFVQLKGGSGKTTTTMGVGNAFAACRSEGVLAFDVNPDRGNLARRTSARSEASALTLLAGPRPRRVHDVRAHTQLTPAGLEILASAADPATADSFAAHDYRQLLELAGDYFSLMLADCGTGITHPATQAVLAEADALVIPLDAKKDSADEAVATVEYLYHAYAKDPVTGAPLLDERGERRWLYRSLLSRAVVVISHQHPGRRMFDTTAATHWFNQWVHAVREIPYDRHLDEGGAIDPQLLHPRTRQAYRELAAALAGLFPLKYSPTSGLRPAG